ncbi:hypothetical protein RM545_08700 [Zunongwangia sp. F260]|uniref:Uncharacterized protein n=1 Tax=Autumnicola lenta TaxID=3075593 RepID=A0ABU3CKK6_9FLAO|nr:hypothetical protein [Zunongwangia sp. F260]MDT0646767.1 hypothetical protein [Zunongwangia sp. F260]
MKAATEIAESNNESFLTQSGLDHYAMVTQVGDHNRSDATQSGEGNYFKLRQTGDRNNSILTQSGSNTFRNNDAEVTQIGDDNTSNVEQSGTYSRARVFQRPTGAVTARFNVAEVVQVGDGGAYNEAFVSQYMEDNFSRQEQTGQGNDAYASQQRSGNDSYQYQTGDFNSASAVQGADPYTAIGGNLSTITQNGNYGYAHHNQLNGNNNLAETTQSNDWQHSVIDQSGDSHKAFVIQQ